MAWWYELTGLNQFFFAAAAFFSVFFVWQIVAALLGLGALGHDMDVSHDAGMTVEGQHAEMQQDSVTDAQQTVVAFKLLSIRSVLAFCTLFCWAAALYLPNYPDQVGLALVYSAIWGAAAMSSVAGIFYLMRKMTETGNPRMSTCVGTDGTVYLDIPAVGVGEVRASVSGVVTHVKARSAGAVPLKAGTRVRIVKIVAPNTVEVTASEASNSPDVKPA